MDLGLLGFKENLIKAQINWLRVWLRMQLQTRAESFCMCPSRQARELCALPGVMQRAKTCLPASSLAYSLQVLLSGTTHSHVVVMSVQDCHGLLQSTQNALVSGHC